MISNSFYAGHVNLSNAEAVSYPIKGEAQNISPCPRGLRGGEGTQQFQTGNLSIS